ncbi:hypothetical protein KC19_5G132800 [Ceratodon purpureus]|uniref:G domain-containing protein n=1 Tax=Ceratodon purpureus TaxID=3225 RepID=A0A8T0I1X4_CERPU|nr:hypothetical protein KC19_5G132800 [Ceratodon purpureus]
MSTPGFSKAKVTQFSLHDCLSAFSCADAVYEDSNELVADRLRWWGKKYSLVEFGDVHVSLGLPVNRLKFLVAKSYETTFIAFRGSSDFYDTVGDSGISPSRHGRLSTLANEFVGSDSRMLLDVMSTCKRVIFCGHRLGGSLAHLIVLRYWKDLSSLFEVGGENFSKESMISVAFGAPYMFHEMYGVEINTFFDKLHNNIKTCFFDFAHDDDPAVYSSLRPDNRSVDQGSRDQSTGGQALHDKEVVTYLASDRSASQPSRGHERTSMVEGPSPKYVLDPVNVGGGRPGSKTKKQPDSRRLSKNIYLLKGSEQTRSTLKPSSKPWSQEEFRGGYTRALNTDLSLFDPTMGLEQRSKPLELNVTTPEPVVNSVFRTTSDTEKYITITGKYLLFLRGPVIVDAIHPCHIKLQTDTRIIVIDPEREGDSGSLITVSTAFGGATHHLKLEGMHLDGSSTAVRRLLCKIVQTLTILATPPLCHLEGKDSELLKYLDSIVQCVPDLGDKKFLSMFEKISLSDGSREDRAKKIQETLALADDVVKFLTSFYRIRFDDSFQYTDLLIGGGLLLAGLSGIALPVVGFYFLAGGASAGTAAMVCGTGLLGGLSTGVVGAFFDKDGISVPDYPEVLKLAIREASLWSGKGQSSSEKDYENATEAELESLLLAEVERSESFTELMTKTLHGSSERAIVLKSKVFQRATPETKKGLLRRIEIVTKTLRAYRGHLSSSKFVGIVGAEDAGKSTFIKKAIEQYGQKDDDDLQKALPKVGITRECHTTVVRPYKLKDKLWIVDFPGGNGTEAYADAWTQFAALPSSCILMLDFKDKIKEPQRLMYEKMKADLVPHGEESKISVVFNKVDKKFTNSTAKTYNAAYFDKQRETAAQHLKCKIEDVYFACLNPYPKEKLLTLRSYGVIGFEDLAQKVLGLGG